MKKVILLMSIFFATAFFSQSLQAQTEAQRVELCARMNQGATFLLSYSTQLNAANEGQRPPQFNQGVALTKGNKYRFTICNNDELPGEAILQIYLKGRLLGSNYNAETGTMLQSIDFDCSVTDGYIVIIRFRDGREGAAVFVVSHVRTL